MHEKLLGHRGLVLLLDGVLTSELLSRAPAHQQETGQKLGECLVRLGVDETPVLRLLAQEFQTRFVSTEKLAQAKVARSCSSRCRSGWPRASTSWLLRRPHADEGLPVHPVRAAPGAPRGGPAASGQRLPGARAADRAGAPWDAPRQAHGGGHAGSAVLSALYNRLGMIVLNHQRDYARATTFFQKVSDLEPENSLGTMNLYSVRCLIADATSAGQKKAQR
ncbi:hypothetical protein LZ198_28350 [Myxococcus sp. K15C18031901]|uniref:hypothetical protein n=1 Tax=Myxococcus dinghuensis TaxID=2906761 RepID=UPI0020A745B2|nr:hypothetical protein [Myxococcus dinghuensis]MCP3102794.1 hypothetical protein [Myxococcus dinghuensis]